MTPSQQAPSLVELMWDNASDGWSGDASAIYPDDAAKIAEQFFAARITELELELLRTNLAWDDSLRLRQSALSRAERAEAQCRVLQEAMQKIATDPYQHGQRVQRMKMIAAQALSLSGGGEPVQKLHELELAANHPGKPDSSSQSQPSADAGPYQRSLEEQRSRALAAFATHVLEALWEGYDLDGGDIQDLGLKFGLIKAVAYDPSTHVDVHGVGPEPGSEWFIQEPWLTDLAAGHQPSDGGRG